MKTWGVFVALAGLVAAWAPLQPKPVPLDEVPWTLVVSGDTGGYLSPCGCTSPMTGGIRRRATAIQDLARKSHVVLLDSGNLASALGRQSEMKAETMGQALNSMHAAAVALTAQDARLGAGILSSVARLAENRLVASELPEGKIDGVGRFAEQGPFLIGSVSPGLSDALRTQTSPPDVVIRDLISTARQSGKSPVLMLDDNVAAARAIAKRYGDLKLIVYRRTGWPPDAAERIGQVWLATPGERGKAIVSLSVSHGELGGYRVTRLGPQFKDDPEVDRLYREYLKRVDREDLLSLVAKAPSEAYAGSATCAKCHSGADKVWKSSGHAHALRTLETGGHGRDPDCVSCHVTALPFETGFVSRVKTPDFSFVGCESCHGPGQTHSLNPKSFAMPKIGATACVPCHTADQSPNFNFLTYWQKIAHK